MPFQRRPNSDRSPESLEARLRALPQPPVPGDLKARILAAVPARRSHDDELPRLVRSASRRWRLAIWAGASVAAAAACLLAVRFWPEPNDQHAVPVRAANPGSTRSASQATPRPRSDSPWFMARPRPGRDGVADLYLADSGKVSLDGFDRVTSRSA